MHSTVNMSAISFEKMSIVVDELESLYLSMALETTASMDKQMYYVLTKFDLFKDLYLRDNVSHEVCTVFD